MKHERATRLHDGHILRKNRLAACILNYISTTCSIYHYLSTNCRSDGVAMYNYIEYEGDLPYTDEQKEELLDEWEKATRRARIGPIGTMPAIFEVVVSINGTKVQNAMSMVDRFSIRTKSQQRHLSSAPIIRF